MGGIASQRDAAPERVPRDGHPGTHLIDEDVCGGIRGPVDLRLERVGEAFGRLLNICQRLGAVLGRRIGQLLATPDLDPAEGPGGNIGRVVGVHDCAKY